MLRTEEHGGKDKQSWIFKHSSTTKHPKAKDDNFEILATNYPDRRKRKLAEEKMSAEAGGRWRKQAEELGGISMVSLD